MQRRCCLDSRSSADAVRRPKSISIFTGSRGGECPIPAAYRTFPNRINIPAHRSIARQVFLPQSIQRPGFCLGPIAYHPRGDIMPEILVVGAGPVGLTMAAELARHGVNCRIIDRLVEPLPYCR